MPYKDPEKRRQYLREYNANRRDKGKRYPSQAPGYRSGRKPTGRKRNMTPEEYASSWDSQYQSQLEAARVKRNQIRSAAVEKYGGRCNCCGETRVVFLEIHHVAGGGGKIRKKMGTWPYYQDMVDNDREGIEVLCANCHTARHRGDGICPHQTND